jgi:hypothetical protein
MIRNLSNERCAEDLSHTYTRPTQSCHSKKRARYILVFLKSRIISFGNFSSVGMDCTYTDSVLKFSDGHFYISVF